MVEAISVVFSLPLPHALFSLCPKWNLRLMYRSESPATLIHDVTRQQGQGWNIIIH